LGLLVDPILDCGVCGFEFLDIDEAVLVSSMFLQVVHSSGKGCGFWAAEGLAFSKFSEGRSVFPSCIGIFVQKRLLLLLLRLVGREDSGVSASWAAVSQKLKGLDIEQKYHWFDVISGAVGGSSSCSFVF
jgi:hypothetical protein